LGGIQFLQGFIMSIVSYFKERAELKSTKALAKVTIKNIAEAIAQGDATRVNRIMDVTPLKALELIPTLENNNLMEAAFDKGQADIVDVLLKRLYGENPNQCFETSVSEHIGNNSTAERTTRKTYLFSAMEQKKPEITFYLARHPGLELDALSTQTFRGNTTWQISGIQAAREMGMLQVVIALAERLAEKRRVQGQEYLDKMLAEAEGYDHEAQQLQQLDLPSGVFRLPALNQY
jgi:hypothetical protein